jgi:hypothetical protein
LVTLGTPKFLPLLRRDVPPRRAVAHHRRAHQAARLQAAVRGADRTVDGVGHFTSPGDFRVRTNSSASGIEDMRATHGALSVSTDGVRYQAASPSQARTVGVYVKGALAFLGRGATDVEDRGTRTVDRTVVEEYRGIFSAAAVRAQFGSLLHFPAGASIEDGTTTVDVDHATGLPVHMQDAVTLSIDLATIRPRLPGRLIATVTTTRDFSHFGSPR